MVALQASKIPAKMKGEIQNGMSLHAEANAIMKVARSLMIVKVQLCI